MSGRARRVARLAGAILASLVCAVAAIGLWVVGQARYTEDYCQTRVDEPAAPAGVEGLSGRPAYLDGPVTIRCDYDQVPDLTVTDPLPLVGALVLIVLVLGVVAVTIEWARRPTRSPSQDRRRGWSPETRSSAASSAWSCR